MEDESKFRVETPDEEKDETTGLLRPLPEDSTPKTTQKGKVEPIVKLLGISMTERHGDLVVLVLIPLLIGLIDASLFSQIMVFRLEANAFNTFVIPMLAAIPVGLVIGKTNQTLIAALLTTLFFTLFFVLFLISPAFAWPALDIGQFFISGMIIAAVYVLLVVFASLLGALIGAVIREFF